MKRIGIAASKMAKGNLALYNCYVVLISFLFSLFIFVIAGATVVLALAIVAYVGSEVMAFEFEKAWPVVLPICMTSLTVVIVLFNLFAISQNFKFFRKKSH